MTATMTLEEKESSGEIGNSGEVGSDIEMAGKNPRISLTTYLAVFACDMIYLAQTWCLVGAGAVGCFWSPRTSWHIVADSSLVILPLLARLCHCSAVQRQLANIMADNIYCNLTRRPWAHLRPSRRLLGT